ncbi:TPA: type VI secretion system baseplate subunit TssF [Escherichia coli]|nr:type VI secretion system baseplate subunit TssF [Escherichia coli]HAW0647583.1 type VI secretion system baseplate subunit TssF [Escherichia coli]
MEFEERYFREELDYLRQLSKLLATEKPHLARFLAEKDADPDIERLLEGVAFLTGNLRQKIEDEFPELTHGLIKMLWPNYLRPVPAMTLIEYTPDMDKSSVPVLIPRNEQFTTNAGEIRVDEVLPSDAKKEEPPPCTFTLCRDIWLLPVRLEQIENRSTTRNGVINITFSVAPGTDFRTLDLNKLRFWLGNDDNYTRDQLYLWFCEYLQGADLTMGEQHIRLPEFMLKAVGFEPQDAMLPWPKNVHSGYRILQEYFCYPDAFLFFDLCGCPALPDGLQAEFFTLQLRFSRPLPVDIRLRRDSLRLYCAPAINLFIHHAEAITLDNRRADYPLVPSRHYQQLTELHRYLLAIQNAPVPGKSALKAVQLRLDQNSSDPIFATRQMAKTLPAPLNRWVGRLTDQAWHVVMVEAVHYMEVDWRDSVVKPFNEQLANNYPFNPRSAQDASLDAFERFFKPDGILDTFYQQNLKLFIDNDLSLEDGDNNVIIREDIIAQLETAQKIRDIFFSKQNGLGTSFAVETVSLSGNKRRSVLNLDGQLVDYSQGRNYTAHLVWPNNMREGNESKLTLIGTSGNAPRSISFSGPWAQFRLFGAGQLTGVQDGNFTVRFSVDGGAMTYRVHTDTEDNPFSGGLFSQFGLSDTLY